MNDIRTPEGIAADCIAKGHARLADELQRRDRQVARLAQLQGIIPTDIEAMSETVWNITALQYVWLETPADTDPMHIVADLRGIHYGLTEDLCNHAADIGMGTAHHPKAYWHMLHHQRREIGYVLDRITRMSKSE